MKKVLIISDYISNVGGIESYIFESKKILQENGFNVLLFGLKGFNNNLPKILRIFGLMFSGFNLIFGIRLFFTILLYKPDIIRFNSLSRFLGWFPVFVSKLFKSKKFMMYHDMGYFHPFPARVYSENQVLTFSLINFVKMADTKSYLIKFFVILKYFSLFLLKSQLNSIIDIHLVPSNFMVKYVQNNYEIDKNKIIIFPHFYL